MHEWHDPLAQDIDVRLSQQVAVETEVPKQDEKAGPEFVFDVDQRILAKLPLAKPRRACSNIALPP